MKYLIFVFNILIFLLLVHCNNNPEPLYTSRNLLLEDKKIKHKFENHYDSLFTGKPDYIVKDFGVPLGYPEGKGYYLAKKFWDKFYTMNHLGEDWSGIGGGDSDFGDTIYAIADGYVSFSEDCAFIWGGVISIVHKVENRIKLFSDTNIVHDTFKIERGKYRYIESFYAHCSKQYVKKGQWVKKGQPIAAIGNSNGRFQAHLHMELRPKAGTEIFIGGYSEKPFGFINPSEFVKKYNAKF